VFLGAPFELVALFELDELLPDGAADVAGVGGELDLGEGRPVVAAEFGGDELFACVGELGEGFVGLRGGCVSGLSFLFLVCSI